MTPLIGVVVVDHDGGDLTVRCVESLLTLEWPPERLRVVLVDNASVDSVAPKLEGRDARLQVVRSETNLGFAGGCNAGIRRLLPDVDYVALLNNDAEAEPGWLGPLVDALEGDPTAGAASSKVLFSSPFVEVALEAPVHVPGRGDNRRLGVRVLGARVDGADGWSRTQFVRGFWGPEHDRGEGVPYQWSAGSALGGVLGSGGSRRGDTVVQAMVKSAARTMGSTVGRQIIRGVLGSLLGGSSKR